MTGPAATHPTADVREHARLLQVDLNLVAGTGAGGAISMADVTDAYRARLGQGSGAARGSRSGPAAHLEPLADLGPRPRLVRTQQSEWERFRTVEVDVYGDNPLLDDLRQVQPLIYAKALTAEPRVPTLFSSGWAPIFSASGFEPALLARLPYFLRPAVARCSDQSLVAEIFDRCGGGDKHAVAVAHASFWMHKALDHTGVSEYRNRIDAWRWATPEPLEPRVVYIDRDGPPLPTPAFRSI